MEQSIGAGEFSTQSTVRLSCQYRGAAIGSGTAFFFGLPRRGGKEELLLVTNRHVIEGVVTVSMRFHTTDAGARTTEIMVPMAEHRWVPHPDSECDLAALRMEDIMAYHERVTGIEMRATKFGEVQLLTPTDIADLDAVEDILTVGYPIGLEDRVNNMPIARRGITATHPALDYEGRAEFLIDAAILPGCSGSPALLFNVGGYARKSGGQVFGTRFKLLGIVSEVMLQGAGGEVVRGSIPIALTPEWDGRTLTGLGCVIKSSRLIEFEGVLPS